MGSPSWRIEMFGGLRAAPIDSPDRAITHFESRRAAALLACLALAPRHMQSRESLAEQLWPNEEWGAIRNRLRQALSSLRRDMKREGLHGHIVVADRSQVRLVPGSVVTDVLEFDAELAMAAATVDPSAQAERLGRAVSLYRGDLLPGYHEETVALERRRLEVAYHDTLVLHSRSLAEIGDLQGAIETSRRALSADPLREDVHCDLMRFYARDGRTSDVIRQFRELETILREELGVSPCPATCEHYDRLQVGLNRGTPIAVSPPHPAGPVRPSAVTQRTAVRRLEPDGGAVPLDSPFYITRPTDHEFQSAVEMGDSIVLVKGPRQVGKTSLLARSLKSARDAGARVVVTDLQKAAPEQLESPAILFAAFAQSIADQLELDVSFDDFVDERRGWNVNFERFMRREVLRDDSPHVVWALDEVDRLFASNFSGVVFGLFRSWHNERSLNPDGPWNRLTLALAYATEAHLFISDLNQSPFNVGTRLVLDDFTRGEVAELNRRYGNPASQATDFDRFFALVGGCPYLVRRGLHVMAEQGLDLAALSAAAAKNDGPFADHLRRMWSALERDEELGNEVRRVLAGKSCSSEVSFFRLRSAGVIVGESPETARPRCGLYRTYLDRALASSSPPCLSR